MFRSTKGSGALRRVMLVGAAAAMAAMLCGCAGGRSWAYWPYGSAECVGDMDSRSSYNSGYTEMSANQTISAYLSGSYR